MINQCKAMDPNRRLMNVQSDLLKMENKLNDFEKISPKELKRELGIKDHIKFPLNEENSLKLKESLDEDGNNLLARCAFFGNLENLKILLECSVIDITGKNNKDQTAADIALERENYDCLLALLKKDSPFPKPRNSNCHGDLKEFIDGRLISASEFPEKKHRLGYLKEFIDGRENLHEKIRQGDLEYVKFVTEREDSRFFLSQKNVSAMYTAKSSKKWDIFAYLQYIQADFMPGEEKIPLTISEEQQLNECMEEYFTESHDAHIYKLLGSTKSVQTYTRVFHEKAEKLYRRLNTIGSMALLMKILAFKDVDVVFDFEKETVDRMRYCTDPSVGLSDGYSFRAYIAAKPLKYEADEKVVAGILAHELCHLVMQIMFKNNCKPYRKHEEAKKEKLDKILQEIKRERKNDILMEMFDYEERYHHSELIARVYQLIAEGKKLQKTSLFEFYGEIVNSCQDYLKDKNKFFKHLNLCHSLQETVGILPKLLSAYGTLRISEEKELDLDKWMEKNNQNTPILTLKTSVPDLTCMSLYVYLRKDFKNHFSKQCIFISVKNFLKHKDIINNAFRCKVCKYLVLVDSEGQKEMKLDELIEEPLSEGKRVIFIQRVPLEEENTGISYDWSDLPEEFREAIMNKDIDFQGRKIKFKDLISKEIASDVIQHKELKGLIEKEVEIGKKYYSEDLPEYFIERSLREMSPDYENKPNFCCKELIEKASEANDIIVSDIFGSGKSTLLINIMKTFKEKYPKLWLVRLKCRDYFQTPEDENSVSHLLKTLKISGTLEGSCLQKFLAMKDRVKIFFDGHQKLKKEDQNKFLEMILKLKQETQCQLWFFTIPQYQAVLQSKIKISVFSICKLGREQQIELLEKYKVYKRKLESSTRVSPFQETSAEQMLNFFSPEFDSIAKEINFLIHLADAFDDAGMASKKLDLLSKIVLRKISMILDKQKVVDDAIRKPLIELYHNEHMNISEQYIKLHEIPSDSKNKVARDYIHHIGLLSPGDFQFLHSIIRDYFCVGWVTEEIEKNFPKKSEEGEEWKIFRSLLVEKLNSPMMMN